MSNPKYIPAADLTKPQIVSMFKQLKLGLGGIIPDAENIKRAKDIIADHPEATDLRQLLQQHVACFEVL